MNKHRPFLAPESAQNHSWLSFPPPDPHLLNIFSLAWSNINIRVPIQGNKLDRDVRIVPNLLLLSSTAFAGPSVNTSISKHEIAFLISARQDPFWGSPDENLSFSLHDCFFSADSLAEGFVAGAHWEQRVVLGVPFQEDEMIIHLNPAFHIGIGQVLLIFIHVARL